MLFAEGETERRLPPAQAKPRGRVLSVWNLAVATVFVSLLAIRAWRLEEVPANVTGDEITFLTDILKIIHFPDLVSPLSLMGDGSQSGINLYFMSFFVRLLSDSQAVLGMRLASSVLSLAVLAAFYIYLRSRFAGGPSLLATLLLGTNFVFLNMSRSTWMGDGRALGLTCGLLSFLLVELAMRKRRSYLVVAAGTFGGLALYSYLGTTFFPLASVLYFAYLYVRRRISLEQAVQHVAVFIAMVLLVFTPNLIAIFQSPDTYGLRSKTVFIGSLDEPYYEATGPAGILWHQLSYTVRGFLLLDSSVSGEGPENERYTPSREAPVDAATATLFFLGIAAAVYRHRRDFFQPVMGFAVMLVGTQMLTVFPPNYARGLYAIPFLYLVIAVLLDRIWSLRAWRTGWRVGVAVVVVAISVWNAQHYFEWGVSHQLAQARQPAILYRDVPLWIAAAKQQIAWGLAGPVITSSEWRP